MIILRTNEGARTSHKGRPNTVLTLPCLDFALALAIFAAAATIGYQPYSKVLQRSRLLASSE
jgi:hypothetical protein